MSFRTLQTRGRPATAGEKMSDESKAFKPGKEPSEKHGERDLISRICRGERELFQSLIEPYQRTVFSVAYSVLNNAADAEELAQ